MSIQFLSSINATNDFHHNGIYLTVTIIWSFNHDISKIIEKTLAIATHCVGIKHSLLK